MGPLAQAKLPPSFSCTSLRVLSLLLGAAGPVLAPAAAYFCCPAWKSVPQVVQAGSCSQKMERQALHTYLRGGQRGRQAGRQEAGAGGKLN